MTELFPGLHKLSGGRKQRWINANLDFIAMLNDQLGFEETRKVLHMKAETLGKALVKSEKRHRPAVTQADRAMNKAITTENKLYDLAAEIDRQSVELLEHTAQDRQLRERLVQYFELQSVVHKQMASLVQSVSDLTYHIISPNKRKVGPTKAIGSGRLSRFHDQGRKRLPRSEVKGTHRHRGHYSRRRRSGV